MTDLFPFHLQARKVRDSAKLKVIWINIAFQVEPLDHGFHRVPVPFPVRVRLLGSTGKVSRTWASDKASTHPIHSWRWTYGIGCLYSLFVVALIVFFGQET